MNDDEMSSDLLATYSPNDGSYETQPLEPVSIGSKGDDYSTTAPDRRPQLHSQMGRDSSAKSLLGALIGGCKTNRLLAYILGATLFASVFNTILLSFVIKSLRLNDRGFADGKITWDETIGATVFELPTSLRAGKSISLNSIESSLSLADKPLKLVGGDAVKDGHGRARAILLLSAANAGDNGIRSAPETSSKAADDEATDWPLISGSSYIALVDDDPSSSSSGKGQKPAKLEIGTKSLKLNLINEKSTPLGQHNGGIDSGADLNRRLKQAGRSSSTGRPMFEFDGRLQSITLPLERELPFYSSAGSSQPDSIVADNALVGADITGTSEDSLRIQTRDGGDLIFESRDTLELMSKSASVKVTTLNDLTLSAGSMALAAGQAAGCYITNGIPYFDSDQPPGYYESAAKQQSTNKPVAAAAADPPTGGKAQLIGRNLIIVDGGILAAS